MPDERRHLLLHAALGLLQLPPRAPELRMLPRWLDSWRGVGNVAAGMHRQGWDLQLTEYGDGRWRATFYVTGMAHSIVGGTHGSRRRGTRCSRGAGGARHRARVRAVSGVGGASQRLR